MSGRSSAPVESITRGSSTLSIGGIAGTEPGRENRVLELNVLGAAARQRHAQRVRVDDLGVALEVLHLSVLRQLPGAARQPRDDVVLEVAQLARSIFGSPNSMPQAAACARLAEDLRDVQQRFRRDAAAIHADAAGIRFGIDERDAESEIRGEKRGGVAARAAADDDELRGDHVRRFVCSRRHRRSHEGHDRLLRDLPDAARTSSLQRQQERLLERLDDPAQEADAVRAVDDAVIVGERERQHHAAARTRRPRRSTGCQTGSMRARETPRMATSGALTIGVKKLPPMPPRFEMLKQPPCISSSEIFRVRAFSASCDSSTEICDDVLRVGVANHRHEQATIGVHGDADVDVLLVDDLARRRCRSTR